MVNRITNLFVHLGPHKTGSTSIQYFLANNYEALVKEGVLYPCSGRALKDTGNVTHYHHPMVLPLIEGNVADFEQYVVSLWEEVAEKRPHTVVISSEALARPGVPKSVFQCLEEALPADNIYWVVYLRRQDELVQSLFAEYIKQGELAWPKGLDKYCTRDFIDHSYRLEFLSSVSQKASVWPISYEEAKHDLFKTFCYELGIPWQSSFQLPGFVNVRRGWGTLALLRYINALPSGWVPPLRRRLFRLEDALEARGKKFLLESRPPLTGRKKAELLEYYSDSNRMVEEKYFGGRPVRLSSIE